jgi:hypothetical protein
MVSKVNARGVSRISILFLFAILMGCPAPTPNGQVSGIKVEEEPELVNGQMDWGAKVSFTVTNTGVGGTIHVNVHLTCSEGEWSRDQDLIFRPNESMTLSYFFQEPTINATNIQAHVVVTP